MNIAESKLEDTLDEMEQLIDRMITDAAEESSQIQITLGLLSFNVPPCDFDSEKYVDNKNYCHNRNLN